MFTKTELTKESSNQRGHQSKMASLDSVRLNSGLLQTSGGHKFLKIFTVLRTRGLPSQACQLSCVVVVVVGVVVVVVVDVVFFLELGELFGKFIHALTLPFEKYNNI